MSKSISVAFLCLFLLANACCGSKSIADKTSEEVPEISPIETYTPPALVEQGNCDQPFTNTTFLKALDELESETAEIARLELAKKILELNCLTSNQITRLMELFSFENSKLEIAQTAYTSCYDQVNYFLVFRALKFEPSKTKLQLYIDGL